MITVAEVCEERNNNRHGLAGVRMRHLPTGRQFTCGGSTWGKDGELLLYTRPPLRRDDPEPRADGLPWATVADLNRLYVPYGADEIVPASECVLTGRWPVVCCRRKRRSRGPRCGPSAVPPVRPSSLMRGVQDPFHLTPAEE